MVNRLLEQRESDGNDAGLPVNIKFDVFFSDPSTGDFKDRSNSSRVPRLDGAADTQSSEIQIATGEGKRLPHNASHGVRRPLGGVMPTIQMKGRSPVNDGAGLEGEAGMTGSKAPAARVPVAAPERLSVTSRRAASPIRALGGRAPIQRAELDAVVAARGFHVGGVYNTWADVVAARALPVAAITANWPAIAQAYTAPGPQFGGVQALDAEAARLVLDARSWSDPQARREASNVLAQMVNLRRTLRNQLREHVPSGAGQVAIMNVMHGQLTTLEGQIQQIKTKYLMAHRAEGAGSETTHKWVGNKKRTVLDLPQGRSLELHNKVNPATDKEQSLGEGGLGYGRFGKLGAETKFVKKQKLKKNEQSAASGVGMPLYQQPEAIQVQNLAWIEQEMEKFRNELDITTNRLNHANVIKTYGGAIGIGKGGAPKAYMVMDMMTGGDLQGVIDAGTATDAVKKQIMLDALDGLAHVHAARLIHRDIKPDNIMLDAAGTAKLIDFGEAVDMDPNDEYRTATKAGTVGYYHPVKIVANEQAHLQLVYDVSTDLYALKRTFEQLAPTLPALTGWIATFPGVNDAVTPVGTAAILRGTLAGIPVP